MFAARKKCKFLFFSWKGRHESTCTAYSTKTQPNCHIGKKSCLFPLMLKFCTYILYRYIGSNNVVLTYSEWKRLSSINGCFTMLYIIISLIGYNEMKTENVMQPSWPLYLKTRQITSLLTFCSSINLCTIDRSTMSFDDLFRCLSWIVPDISANHFRNSLTHLTLPNSFYHAAFLYRSEVAFFYNKWPYSTCTSSLVISNPMIFKVIENKILLYTTNDLTSWTSVASEGC